MHSIRTHLQKEITVTTINWGKPRINFKTYGSNITQKESLYGDKELTIQPESRKRNYSLTLFHTQYKPTSMFKVQTYQKLQGIKSARPSKLSPPEILLSTYPLLQILLESLHSWILLEYYVACQTPRAKPYMVSTNTFTS